MVVEIIRDEKGLAIGWTMKGENPEEISKLGTIRDLQFWGHEGTNIVYDGREGGDDRTGDPGLLKWKQKAHTKLNKKI